MRFGRDHLSQMTDRLDEPGIPRVGAKEFSALLSARCGCRLCWHQTRRVFIVFRPQGSCTPKFYPVEFDAHQWPIHSSTVATVAAVVDVEDTLERERAAITHMDRIRRSALHDEEQAIRADLSNRRGELERAFKQRLKRLSDGSRSVRVFDFAQRP